MLIGNQSESDSSVVSNPYGDEGRVNRHTLKGKYKEGPLYRFLEAVIDKENRQSDLHVIHLRDWHELSPAYDEERRLYGGHCEANTWEAEPIDGYDCYLRPWGKSLTDINTDKHPRSLSGWQRDDDDKVHFYEVLSDSVFDFRYAESIEYPRTVEDKCGSTKSQSHLSLLIDEILEKAGKDTHVYVTVIGVYTDIKVRTLLTGLRSRYNRIANLVVSDVLTGAPDLERHLGALDFIDKVLNVEVISNLNIIVGIMDKDVLDEDGNSTEESPIPVALTSASLKWRDYRNYYLDKQRVLAYQDARLAQYLDLTTERSNRIYAQIENLNVWLIRFGRLSLGLLITFTVALVLGYDMPWEALLATGLASTSQIFPMFISRPQKQLQNNLATLVRLRNYLESYSLVSALLRHHLTSPLQLSSDITDKQEDLLIKRNERIMKHMEIVEKGAHALRANFGEISEGVSAGFKQQNDKSNPEQAG